MPTLKEMVWKDEKGKETHFDIGASAEERKKWDGKVDPNGDVSETTVSRLEETQASFPQPVAGDKQRTLWGKLKKWQQDCIAKFGNYVLTSMITNQHLNSTSNIPTSALVYLMQQAIAQNQQAINVLNTKQNESGIAAPTGGTGRLNTYWADSGMLNYRVVNGVCIIHFNLDIKLQTQEAAVLMTDIPYCHMKTYTCITAIQSQQESTIFYVEDNALKCGAGRAGNYIGCMAYPTI